MSKHWILWPFWFEDDNERSVTVYTKHDPKVFTKFLTTLNRMRSSDRWKMFTTGWWGNAQHFKSITGMASRVLYWKSLQQKVWSWICDHTRWALTNRFFSHLWKYLKDNVYQSLIIHRLFLNWKQSSLLKSGGFLGCESHWQFYKSDSCLLGA